MTMIPKIAAMEDAGIDSVSIKKAVRAARETNKLIRTEERMQEAEEAIAIEEMESEYEEEYER